MLRYLLLLTLCFAASRCGASSRATSLDRSLENQSMAQLEQRLRTIQSELETLATYSPRSGSGSIGYRSWASPEGGEHEWVEVNFRQKHTIDEVVLVPVLRRDGKTGYMADGFPNAYRIWAGTEEDRTGKLVATILPEDHAFPRLAPLVVRFESIDASWVQVEAINLLPRESDGRFEFQLAELAVFSGEDNVALHSSVTASSFSPDYSGAWELDFLVDGHTPYLMASPNGQQSPAYVGFATSPPTLTLDLLKPYPLSRIHLHAVDQSTTVPQAYFNDFGMPRHLVIEGANQADFSDAKPLLDAKRNRITETGPIMMWHIPETLCRYVRITAPTPDPSLYFSERLIGALSREVADETTDFSRDRYRIGYAEIELFANGKNVALGKPVRAEKIMRASHLVPPSVTTDGSNQYGEILALRDWLNQLARRHELETERPNIEAELAKRYAHQKSNLRAMYWVAGILLVCMLAAIISARLILKRRMEATKKRVAADLHDELGANLHAIGLFGDLAKLEIPTGENGRWRNLANHLDEIRVLTELTGNSTRFFSQLLDAESYHENLLSEMRLTANRFLADLRHEHTFPSDEAVQHVSPRRRIDLFLFYKECLTNIIRHSGATEVHTSLTIDGKRLKLSVSDNGIGLNGVIPPSLKRRAQMMRGRIEVEQPTEGGSCVKLQLRTKKAPPLAKQKN